MCFIQMLENMCIKSLRCPEPRGEARFSKPRLYHQVGEIQVQLLEHANMKLPVDLAECRRKCGCSGLRATGFLPVPRPRHTPMCPMSTYNAPRRL